MTNAFPFNIGELDAVVLVGMVIFRHSGRLPKLSADGYKGPMLYDEAQRRAGWRCTQRFASLSAGDADGNNVVADAGKDLMKHCTQRRRGRDVNFSVLVIVMANAFNRRRRRSVFSRPRIFSAHRLLKYSLQKAAQRKNCFQAIWQTSYGGRYFGP